MRRLRIVRKLAGLTQVSLGLKSGTTGGRVSLTETGRYRPTPRELERLAAILNVSQPASLLELVDVDEEVT